jgi:hypothetical protein
MIDFPASPTPGQIFTAGDQSWMWDTVVWMIVSPVPASGVYLQLSGGTMVGQANGITPTAAANLTRKDYVDTTLAAAVAGYLPLTGGTVTGQIKGITPVASADLTRLDYVTGQIATRLALTGGSLSGNLDLAYITPQVTFTDTDSVPGGNLTGMLRFFYSDFSVAGAIGFNSFTQLGITGNLNNILLSADRNNVTAGSFIQMDVDNITSGRLEPAGTAVPQATSIITREKGDARYLQPATADATYAALGATNVFTNTQTVQGPTALLVLNDTDATVGGSAQNRIVLQSNGVLNGQIGFAGADFLIQSQAGMVQILVDTTNTVASSQLFIGIDGVTAASVQPAGTASATAQTVITREKGDNRYTLAASDARYKYNVEPMDPGDFMALRPVRFEWAATLYDSNPPVGRQYGMLAQEVGAIYPEVMRGTPDFYGLDALSLIAILVAQVQQLTRRIDAIEEVT